MSREARFATNLTPTTFTTIESNTPEEPKEKRTRQRKVLSCIRCHRAKVRCDRQQPCKRCVVGKRAEGCVYGTAIRAGTPPSQAEDATTKSDSQHSPLQSRRKSTQDSLFLKPDRLTARKGCIQWSGSSRFKDVIREFIELDPYLAGYAVGFDDTNQRLRDAKKLYPKRRNRNYPFGDHETLLPVENPLLLLPPRLIANVLVDTYFNTFGRTHRLLHRPTFDRELAAFWECPQAWAHDQWFSQLFMILALGCHAHDSHILADAGYNSAALIEQCVDGAQLTFRQGRFMSKPTLTTVRTLCMMALAQQMDLFNDSDAVWILMGLIVRLAVSMGLHRHSSSLRIGLTEFEMEQRRRVWVCVVFLNLQSALESGMPALLHTNDFNSSLPLNLDDCDIIDGAIGMAQPKDIFTEGSLLIKLFESFNVMTKVVDIANAPLPGLDEKLVSDCDTTLRRFLQESIYPSGKCRRDPLLCTTFQTYIRRGLLVLHQCYLSLPLHLQESSQTSRSQSAILDSSLALLVIQRNLEDIQPCHWLTDLFKDAFVLAAAHVGVGLRRGDYPASFDGITHVSPRDTAQDALKACLEIWGKRVKRTSDNFKLYIGLSYLVYALEAMRDGRLLLEAMKEAAESGIALAFG